MPDLTVVPTAVGAIRIDELMTLPAAAATAKGAYVYRDANGKLAKGDASAAASAGKGGINIETATAANETISAIVKGLVDLGNALDGVAIGATVYLSDTDGGILGTTAGTNSLAVGTVYPIWTGSTVNKVLRVDL